MDVKRAIGSHLTPPPEMSAKPQMSENRFRALIENAPDLSIVFSKDGDIDYVSPSVQRIGGWRPDELLGRNILEFIHPDDHLAATRDLSSIVAKPDSTGRAELRYRHKDGSWRVFETLSRSLLGDPAVGGVVANMRDITERKSAEQSLRDSEETLRTITSSTQDAIVMMDSDGVVEFWNDSAARLLGYTAQEAVGKPLHELIAPDRLRKSADVAFERFKSTGRGPILGTLLELPTMRKDRTEFLAEHSISALMLKDQWHAVTILRDVTERTHAELALSESEARLRAIFDAVQDGILVADVQARRFLLVNHAMCRMLGYNRDDLLKSRMEDIHPKEDVPHVVQQFERMWKGEIGLALNLPMQRKDGTVFQADVSGAPVKFGDNVCVAGIFRDISDRQRTQDQLAAQMKQLEGAMLGTVRAVSAMLDMRDPYTAGHQHRVATLARAIGVELGLTGDRLKGLEMIGLVHDLGKIAVPAEILSKPGTLTAHESALLKEHPQAGHDIMKGVEFPWPLAETVLQHHERLDGSGYPRGLKGEEIILEARILAVADVVESMASRRPYRSTLGIDAALEEIETGSGRLYDPRAAGVCLRLFRDKGYVLPAADARPTQVRR